ncbi:MAG: glutamate--tRNA ligase, partial [Gemmatimonas sp.]
QRQSPHLASVTRRFRNTAMSTQSHPDDHPAPVRPRVRFAPSPTGSLHVGGARTALFNWLLARKYNGTMLLRVEDTDRARSTDESTRAIFEGLNWLGLNWDEEVVYQGANVARHVDDAERLITNGSAYRDFSTAAEIEAERKIVEAAGGSYRFDRKNARLDGSVESEKIARGEPYAIRFKVPEGSTSWNDLVHGTITFDNSEIEDFVILRSDRTPVYNMAVVSDDIEMRITLVMRGDDHISNTPKQILLYQALGANVPQFAHVPMILGDDGKKLSKRHGATAVGDYQYKGMLPSAMVNFLSLLGWSTGDDIEVMTLPQLIEKFNVNGLQKKAAVFDHAKLEWMNGQHLAHNPIAEIEAQVWPAFERGGLATVAELTAKAEWYRALLELLRVRARTIDEIVKLAAPYFRDTLEYDADSMAKQWKDRTASRDILSAVHAKLSTLNDWTLQSTEENLRALAAELGVGNGKIFQPLRVALTGQAASPGIFEVLLYVGRERSLQRLATAVQMLNS